MMMGPCSRGRSAGGVALRTGTYIQREDQQHGCEQAGGDVGGDGLDFTPAGVPYGEDEDTWAACRPGADQGPAGREVNLEDRE